jgi:hypothetical protein
MNTPFDCQVSLHGQTDDERSIVDDEVVMVEDVSGQKKVDRDGNLLSGRHYRCRKFTVITRGNRLYMLATEPARCVGYPDSYKMFLNRKHLYKVVATDEEKDDLIHRGIIPKSYMCRTINLVTARSIFREFGAYIVVGGRHVIDDFYEALAIDRCSRKGQLADPEDLLPGPGQEYDCNRYVGWHESYQGYKNKTAHWKSYRKGLTKAQADPQKVYSWSASPVGQDKMANTSSRKLESEEQEEVILEDVMLEDLIQVDGKTGVSQARIDTAQIPGPAAPEESVEKNQFKIAQKKLAKGFNRWNLCGWDSM